MSIDDVRAYCLSLPGTTEGLPFGNDVLVFKVGGKMFCLLALEALPTTITLKCDPAKALDLRDRYASVAPGYHMNKRHWNTVTLGGDYSARLLRKWIDHSYEAVFSGLTKATRMDISEGA